MPAWLLLFLFVSLHCLGGDSSDTKALNELLGKAVDAEHRNDFTSARELYVKATETFPGYSQAWAAYGEHLRFYVHDDDAANGAFHKAIDAAHGDTQAVAFAWRGLGELEAKKGNETEAIRMMEKSLSIVPLSDTHRSLCHLYVMKKDWKNAAAQARAAAELEPGDPIAALLFAAQLQRAGETEAGREEFQKALKIAGCDEHGRATGPVHCCVLYNAAGYYAVSGQKQPALEMLKAFFNTPNHLHLTRRQIEDDSDFEDLRSSPEFMKLLDEYVPKDKEK